MSAHARVELAPGFILSRRDYRDTSLLLEVFTAAHGRVGLVARGVRTRGRRGGSRGDALQALRPLLLSYTAGGELGTLREAEADGPAVPLTGERIFCAWYVNELLLKGLPRGDPHPELYYDYVATLHALVTGAPEPPLRRFELALLAGLGYALPVEGDGVMEPQQRYDFDHENGAQPSVGGEWTGAQLSALRDGDFDDPATERALRPLLREAIQRLVGHRKLDTPAILREMRRYGRPERDAKEKDEKGVRLIFPEGPAAPHDNGSAE